MLDLNVKFGFFPCDVKTFLYFRLEKKYLSESIILKQVGEALFLQLEFLLKCFKICEFFIRSQMFF